MKPLEPQLHPKETLEPVPFSARDRQLNTVLEHAVDFLSVAEWREFMKEIKLFANYLRDKYGEEAHKHTIFHVLTSSSFFPNDGVNLQEDFPGDDSVEVFINHLVDKYRNKLKV